VLGRTAFFDNGTFVLPVPAGLAFETVRVKVLEGRYGQGGDDDPVDADPKAIWKALAGYAAAKAARSQTAYPYVSDVFQLFRALDRPLGKADADGDGRKDLAEVFRAHGFFADANGNFAPDAREQTGLTSHPELVEDGVAYPELDPRYTAGALPEQLVALATGGVDAQSVVFVDYPGEGGYRYLATRDGEGRIVLAVPPAGSGATVTVVTLAGGYLPGLAELDAESFWAEAAEHPGEPFLQLDAGLEPGELRLGGSSDATAPAYLLVGGGAILAVVALALLARRRVAAP
jgi:hypothetical protein